MTRPFPAMSYIEDRIDFLIALGIINIYWDFCDLILKSLKVNRILR